MVIEKIKVRRLRPYSAKKVKRAAEVRRTLAALVTPIPNQYAQEGVAFNYTFPVGTFSGTSLTYTAYVNRPGRGRKLPSWLSFNPATRTFSGTATKWWELETLQIVVEADDSGTKAYSIFILTIGAADNVGRICWRAGDEPAYMLNAANIGAFDPSVVAPGDWVAIATDLTRDPVTQAVLNKINDVRTNGGFLVWLWNNNNGLKGHLTNYFDFDLVEAGETVAIDASLGATKAFNPYGRLWRGIRGKEIYVTNYNEPVTITSRNYQDFTNVSAIRCNRASAPNDFMQDRHIRFIGQPNNNVPFINMHGLKLREAITWQIDGSNGYIEAAFCDVDSGSIGFHWKPNTTDIGGDRRPWLNHDGWDMNQSHTYIHDCLGTSPNGTEIIYLGGGGWGGADVHVMHFNTDGTPKMVLVNGVNVQEYHILRRFNSVHDHIRIEHNIFTYSGWDAIQTRCVVSEMRMMYNYIYKTGQGPTVNNVQAEGIMSDGGIGEIAYNYIELAGFSGIRCGMLGYDFIHHNVIVDAGQESGFPSAGTAIYGNDRGLVTQDYPQVFINASRDLWSSATTYDYDSFQHEAKVRYDGKAYRSLQANNINHQPDISPTWWEDTHEGDSYVADTGLVEADLVWKCYNNTAVNCKNDTLKLFVPQARKVKNNLFINCNSVLVNTGVADVATNIALVGVVLTDYFQDPDNKDFRLKAGASAINAGTNLDTETDQEDQFHDGFKDFSGEDHDAIPSVGAFETGSPVSDHYVYVVNDVVAPPSPPPITVDVGLDTSFNLPQNSIDVTLVKSDPARTLDTIVWSQASGPAPATILNQGTVTATFADLVPGIYTFVVDTVDEYGQGASDQIVVTVNPAGIVSYTTFQWFLADDVNGTNESPISDSNKKSLDVTPYVGTGKYVSREVTPVSKTGVLIGQPSRSNWIGPL